MTPLRSPTLNRRTVLTGLAASLGSFGLAGCLDVTDGGEEATKNSDSSDESSTEIHADSSDESSTEIHADYESTDVRVTTPDGDELGEVTAAIADTPNLQRLGLSDTEELPEDRAMLFVYEGIEDRRFGMPDMSFGIDIVFADDEGVITSIFHAPQPEPDDAESEHIYPGRGQYVLEVVYEWTAERGVEEGDVLNFDL
ncbi:DUF192 domain-containing protein [Natronococcus wangiae]|uniref:DUF192 domain-containing protein n=1 Tax=Natronococcus wangiae TaxID=3068275 RepID=UPI00273DDB26|nr:DUF192 domain-containing protein [Natronococcus sp. AD5]